MITLTANQKLVVDAITAEPGTAYRNIAERTGLVNGVLSPRLYELIKKGIVRREGTMRLYRYYLSDEPFEVKPEAYEGITDPFLKEAVETKLTDEQLRFIKINPKVKRSELARRFGMSRLELNFAIDRLKSK